MYRNPKILAAAQGKHCTMRSPMCNGDPNTVCWCHSNFSEHGKGVGLKAHDIFGFFGCSGCHRWFDIDSRRGDSAAGRRAMFHRAHSESLLMLVQEGVLK
jgi:hypothetical protein